MRLGLCCQGVLCRREDRQTEAVCAAVGEVGPAGVEGVFPLQSQSPVFNDQVVSSTERGQITVQSLDVLQKAVEASGRI